MLSHNGVVGWVAPLHSHWGKQSCEFDSRSWRAEDFFPIFKTRSKLAKPSTRASFLKIKFTVMKNPTANIEGN